MGLVTSKEYEVNYYEVDCRQKVTPTYLINYFSDVASKQSDERNIGIDFMEETKIAWVLYQWDVDIKRYPKYREKITVKTEPYSFKKFYAYRLFEVLDENNNLLVSAKSVWFLIDIEKRRPKKIPQFMYEAYEIEDDTKEILKIEKIRNIEKISNEKQFNVRYSDIDTNKHVNNAKYVSWVIESVPVEIVLNCSLKNILITYEKETMYGEVITVITEVVEEADMYICIHKIMDKENNKITAAKTIWTKQ